MSERTEYHVAVRMEGSEIIVMGQLSRRQDLPITRLEFTPQRSTTAYPVVIYWKSTIPDALPTILKVEQAILAYCTQLYQEAAYEGPLDCCL